MDASFDGGDNYNRFPLNGEIGDVQGGALSRSAAKARTAAHTALEQINKENAVAFAPYAVIQAVTSLQVLPLAPGLGFPWRRASVDWLWSAGQYLVPPFLPSASAASAWTSAALIGNAFAAAITLLFVLLASRRRGSLGLLRALLRRWVILLPSVLAVPLAATAAVVLACNDAHLADAAPGTAPAAGEGGQCWAGAHLAAAVGAALVAACTLPAAAVCALGGFSRTVTSAAHDAAAKPHGRVHVADLLLRLLLAVLAAVAATGGGAGPSAGLRAGFATAFVAAAVALLVLHLVWQPAFMHRANCVAAASSAVVVWQAVCLVAALAEDDADAGAAGLALPLGAPLAAALGFAAARWRFLAMAAVPLERYLGAPLLMELRLRHALALLASPRDPRAPVAGGGGSGFGDDDDDDDDDDLAHDGGHGGWGHAHVGALGDDGWAAVGSTDASTPRMHHSFSSGTEAAGLGPGDSVARASTAGPHGRAGAGAHRRPHGGASRQRASRGLMHVWQAARVALVPWGPSVYDPAVVDQIFAARMQQARLLREFVLNASAEYRTPTALARAERVEKRLRVEVPATPHAAAHPRLPGPSSHALPSHVPAAGDADHSARRHGGGTVVGHLAASARGQGAADAAVVGAPVPAAAGGGGSGGDPPPLAVPDAARRRVARLRRAHMAPAMHIDVVDAAYATAIDLEPAGASSGSEALLRCFLLDSLSAFDRREDRIDLQMQLLDLLPSVAPDLDFYLAVHRESHQRRMQMRASAVAADGQGIVDPSQQLAYEHYLDHARTAADRARQLGVSFWHELAESVPNLDELFGTGGRINEAVRLAETNFQRALAAYPTSTQALRLRAAFTLDVLNDPDSAQDMIAQADALEEDVANAETAAIKRRAPATAKTGALGGGGGGGGGAGGGGGKAAGVGGEEGHDQRSQASSGHSSGTSGSTGTESRIQTLHRAISRSATKLDRSTRRLQKVLLASIVVYVALVLAESVVGHVLLRGFGDRLEAVEMANLRFAEMCTVYSGLVKIMLSRYGIIDGAIAAHAHERVAQSLVNFRSLHQEIFDRYDEGAAAPRFTYTELLDNATQPQIFTYLTKAELVFRGSDIGATTRFNFAFIHLNALRVFLPLGHVSATEYRDDALAFNDLLQIIFLIAGSVMLLPTLASVFFGYIPAINGSERRKKEVLQLFLQIPRSLVRQVLDLKQSQLRAAETEVGGENEEPPLTARSEDRAHEGGAAAAGRPRGRGSDEHKHPATAAAAPAPARGRGGWAPPGHDEDASDMAESPVGGAAAADRDLERGDGEDALLGDDDDYAEEGGGEAAETLLGSPTAEGEAEGKDDSESSSPFSTQHLDSAGLGRAGPLPPLKVRPATEERAGGVADAAAPARPAIHVDTDAEAPEAPVLVQSAEPYVVAKQPSAGAAASPQDRGVGRFASRNRHGRRAKKQGVRKHASSSKHLWLSYLRFSVLYLFVLVYAAVFMVYSVAALSHARIATANVQSQSLRWAHVPYTEAIVHSLALTPATVGSDPLGFLVGANASGALPYEGPLPFEARANELLLATHDRAWHRAYAEQELFHLITLGEGQLYGITELASGEGTVGLREDGSGPEQIRLNLENACVEGVPNCTTLANGAMARGLQLASIEYRRYARDVVALLGGEPTMQPVFASSTYRVAEALASRSFRPPMERSLALYSAAAFDDVDDLVTMLWVLAATFSVICLAVFLLLYRPLLRQLDNGIKDTGLLLLLLPMEVIHSVGAVRDYMRNQRVD